MIPGIVLRDLRAKLQLYEAYRETEALVVSLEGVADEEAKLRHSAAELTMKMDHERKAAHEAIQNAKQVLEAQRVEAVAKLVEELAVRESKSQKLYDQIISYEATLRLLEEAIIKLKSEAKEAKLNHDQFMAKAEHEKSTITQSIEDLKKRFTL